jgi:hypothetical protein
MRIKEMGSTADAGRCGEDAAPDATMEGTGPDGGDAAVDAMTDAGGRRTRWDTGGTRRLQHTCD